MRSQHHFSNFNMANAAGQRLAGMARHASLTGTGGRATSSHFLQVNAGMSQTGLDSKRSKQMTQKTMQGGKQRPAYSAHPTRGKQAVAIGGTSSSVLTHQAGHPGGQQTLAGRTQAMNRSSQNWVQAPGVDYTKVNFGKLTGDATESQGQLPEAAYGIDARGHPTEQ